MHVGIMNARRIAPAWTPRRLARHGVILLTLVAAPAAAAVAQDSVPHFARLCDPHVLPPGRLTRVQMFNERRSDVGPLVSCSRVELVLGPGPSAGEGTLVLPAPGIAQVWARANRSLEGGIVGFVLGAVSAYTASAVAGGICQGSSGPYTCGSRDRLRTTVIGAAVGALLGWAIGRGLPRWSRRFP